MVWMNLRFNGNSNYMSKYFNYGDFNWLYSAVALGSCSNLSTTHSDKTRENILVAGLDKLRQTSNVWSN